MQRSVAVDFYIERADEIRCKVIAGQFKEQLVFFYRIRLVGIEEDEGCLTVVDKCFCFGGIIRVEHFGAPLPDIADVEPSSAQSAASLHAVDNHARHFGQFALRITLDHFFHPYHTRIGVSLVECHHSIDEDELVAVGPVGESLSRDSEIATSLSVALLFECVVSGLIERVFDMYAKAGIFEVIRVGHQLREL